MTKNNRKFQVTRDKTTNLVNIIMADAQTGNMSRIQNQAVQIICVPGTNTIEDKYMYMNQDQYKIFVSKVGNRQLAESLVLMNTAEVIELFKRAKIALERRQKSGFLDIAYNQFNIVAKRMEQRYNQAKQQR